MPLTCNIDSRGKVLRLISGIIVSLISVALLIWWALPSGRWTPWLVSLALLAFGAFQIFEARAGWCAVRAMGFKTRI